MTAGKYGEIPWTVLATDARGQRLQAHVRLGGILCSYEIAWAIFRNPDYAMERRKEEGRGRKGWTQVRVIFIDSFALYIHFHYDHGSFLPFSFFSPVHFRVIRNDPLPLLFKNIYTRDIMVYRPSSCDNLFI